MSAERLFSLRVLLLAFSLAVGIGAVNNALNPHRIPWTGRAKVLHSDDGDLPEPHWQGALKGLRYGAKEIADNGAATAGVALVAAGLVVAGRRRGMAWGPLLDGLFRVGLAAMFAAAAAYKLKSPKEFALTVTQYKLLPDAVVNPFALWMPAEELVLALGIVLTRRAREMYLGLTVLWVMFIIALAQAVLRRLGITCGCFDIAGATTTGEAWFSLLRDLVLVVPTAWLAFRAPQRSLWELVRDRGR